LTKVFFNKYSFLFLAVFYCAVAQAQDFSDSRKKTESFAKLQPKEVRADVATFALAGISESVNTVPLPKIDYSSYGNDSMVFDSDGIKAIIKTAPFVPENHKLSYDDKYLIRIDKRPYYGDYGNMPKTEISDVIFIWGKDTVPVPPAAYNDLHNLHFTYLNKGVQRTGNAIYHSKDGRRTYLYLFSKDNTGSYEVTWIFQDGRYIRRVLDYGFM
jgi:hypothetical protein